MRYHTTATSGLQAIARLARASPYIVVITVPVEQAARVAERQIDRYPSITQSPGTRTALRQVGCPVVQLVILPPTDGQATLILLSNLIPQDSRELWRLALDPDEPLRWRNYELARTTTGAITWRLSERVRAHYQTRINRLVTGRGGRPQPGERPYQLSPETARQQVIGLAAHLAHYPGFSGVRQDIFALAQHSTRVWRSTHPQEPIPLWPTMFYLIYQQPKTSPLSTLVQRQEKQHEENQ